jgi:hypothetical protein
MTARDGCRAETDQIESYSMSGYIKLNKNILERNLQSIFITKWPRIPLAELLFRSLCSVPQPPPLPPHSSLSMRAADTYFTLVQYSMTCLLVQNCFWRLKRGTENANRHNTEALLRQLQHYKDAYLWVKYDTAYYSLQRTITGVEANMKHEKHMCGLQGQS